MPLEREAGPERQGQKSLIRFWCSRQRGDADGCEPGRRAWLRLLGLAALLAASPWPVAGASAASEEEVKAAFLTKFSLYVSWPPALSLDPKKPFVIGLLGRVPFAEILESRAAVESERGNLMSVRRLSSARDADGVHLVFVGASEAAREPALLPELARGGSLLVGESEQFLEHGGMIRLVLDNKRVKFDVDVAAAERAGLKVSAKMLQHARTVRGAKR